VTSLRRLLDNDILEHLERIGELSDSASREFSIEKALDKMVADWEGLAFELGTWKSTGTHILKGERCVYKRPKHACRKPSA
jgi:dynein heavy chain